MAEQVNCKNALLVNITQDESQKDNFMRTVKPVIDKESSKTRLCGYLTRLNPSGLIKGPKTHWFDFEKDKCELYYYRSSSDSLIKPIGCIPINIASFSCSAEGLRSNIFIINVNDKQYILQACDKETMLWWLQELQVERRLFNFNTKYTRSVSENARRFDVNISSYLKKKTIDCNTDEPLVSLIPDTTLPEPEGNRDSLTILPVIPRLEAAPSTVGDQAVGTSKARASSFTTSIGHGLADIGNLMPGRSSLRRIIPKSENFRRSGKERQDRKVIGALGNEAAEKIYTAAKAFTNAENKIINNNSTEVTDIKETLLLAQEEIDLLKSSLMSKEETIELLKKEMSQQAKLSENPSNEKNVGTIPSKVKMLQELEDQKEQIVLFQEMLKAKDEIVMQLTNQLFDVEKEMERLQNEVVVLQNSRDDGYVVLSTEDLNSNNTVNDEVEAYKLQNKLLNNEIIELSHLNNNAYKNLDLSHDQILEKEARYCQLESKYLILLSESSKPRAGTFTSIIEGETATVVSSKVDKNIERTEIVKRLIEDALQDSTASSVDNSRGSRHDKHGFSLDPEDRDESSFLMAASMKEQRAANIYNTLNEHDTSVYVKWENYVALNREFHRTEELKMLLRLGIPHELRPHVWKWLVSLRTKEKREILDPNGNYYETLLQKQAAPLYAKQIELDLLRTLPNNKHFSSTTSRGIGKLRRILQAYSIHNPTIGYCQGLNRIAAIALLYLNESDSFWCLVAIVECIMPLDYYSSTLTASQADQRVLRDLIADKIPRLHRHFELLNVDTSLITFNWFLCVFCDNVPSETMLRVWDTFLNEGCKILFRFSLAFFKHIEDEILKAKEYIAVFNVLRGMSHMMHDSRTIARTAFQGMNPFPRSKIERLRTRHLENVRKELAELDAIRQDFAEQRNETVNSDMFSDDEDSGE